MTVPPWLRTSIVAVVMLTALQLVASWATCSFFYGPQLLKIHSDSGGQIALGQSCDGAGDKATAGLSALLATLISLSSQPPHEP